jgi:hypothetical protein
MAGTAKRAAAHKKKMADKRAAKAAKRAAYLTMRGTSKKNKKRQPKGLRLFSAGKHKHLMAACGNTGCLRCFPRLNLSFYAHKIMMRGDKYNYA